VAHNPINRCNSSWRRLPPGSIAGRSKRSSTSRKRIGYWSNGSAVDAFNSRRTPSTRTQSVCVGS